MAENLKVASFRFTKWAVIVLLGLLALAYVKLKTDLFWEQCRSVDEENYLTGWKAALNNVWTWLASTIWQSSHDQQPDNKYASAERDTIPLCHASVSEILSHVVVTSIRKDVTQFCIKVSNIIGNSCTSIQHALRMIGREGKVTLVSIFNASADSFRMMWEKLQNGFNTAITEAAIVYKEFLTVVPDRFGTIAVIIFCVLCILSVVFICWKKQKCRQIRNNFNHNRYQSHKNDHASQDFTPLSTRTHKPRTEIVQSFDSDLAKQICPRTIHSVETDSHRVVNLERRRVRSVVLSLVYVMVMLLCISVPWEFCRLYQLAVANKAAVASAGVPLECSTESLSLLQTLTLWLSQQLAWSHGNPCDRYYQAVLVDPLWEMTPLMVLTSLVTRSIVHPAEMLAAGLGRALRHFFTEIPLHWQPICMLLIVTFTFILLLLSCSYRFSIPMLFRIEPKTPVLACSGRRGKTQNCKTDGIPCRGVSAFGEDTAGESSSLACGRRTGDVCHHRLADERCLNCSLLGYRHSASDLSSWSQGDEQCLSGRCGQHQNRSPSINLLTDRHSSFVQTRSFNIDTVRDVSRTGRFRRNESLDMAHDVTVIEDQKENLENMALGNVRGRRRTQRNLSPERTLNVTARSALRDMEVTSNKDRFSVVDVCVKQKAGKVRQPKREVKRFGRQK